MYKKYVSRERSEIVFLLPSSFAATDYLKGPLAKRTDCLNYLVSTILRRQATGAGHGNHNFVTLNASELNKIMAKDDAHAVIEAAVNGGAIEIDKHYVKGCFSRGYRLNERFINDKIVRVKPTGKRIMRALERQRNEQPVHHKAPQKTSKLIQQMTDQYHKLEINIDQARELISRLPEDSNPFDRQSVIIQDLVDKNFIVFPTQWGRLYNNISGLHSLVRPALSYRGARLHSVDVKNSQPAFLGLLAQRSHLTRNQHHPVTPTQTIPCPHNTNPGNPAQPTSSPANPVTRTPGNICLYDSENPLECPPDLALFISEVSEGRFYESFLAELDRNRVTVPTVKYARTRRKMERQDVKDGFMMHVLAKKGRYRSEFRNIFAKRYPAVDAEIRRTNQSDYRNLIRELQRLEADFVIHNVAAGALLLPSKPLVLTLHDCIICGEGETDLIEGEFERGFREIRYRMKLTHDLF
jgi:hypothetical protein